MFLNDFNAVEAYPSKSHTAYLMPLCSWMFSIDPQPAFLDTRRPQQAKKGRDSCFVSRDS